MENFPSLTAALIGLERYENLELSTTTAATEAAGPAKHLSKQLGKRAGGRKGISLKLRLEPRVRLSSSPCAKTVEISKLQNDPRLTDAAKKLKKKKLALLYEDILKPIDFSWFMKANFKK